MDKWGVRNAGFILGLDEVPTWEKYARLYNEIRHTGLEERERAPRTARRIKTGDRVSPFKPIQLGPGGSEQGLTASPRK